MIKSITNTLTTILEYYYQTRGVGHTSALLGEQTIERPLFLSDTLKNAIVHYGKTPISLSNLGQSLAGRKAPLIIDNYALTIIFQEALKKINDLESKVLELEEQIKNG